ncbi:MAG: CoA transferase [Clostridiales Family XIII bacterium]|jgi:crotonobetainyl-CoA:carnitine CoA-transferase CaiB-like acyl-CoA transferase|nr:CoA transferase [Clostridiales Family XIII bacterium]
MKTALEGLKILDFTTLLPGPFATMNLADMGAEVLRVSTNTRTDLVDSMPPLIDAAGRSGASVADQEAYGTAAVESSAMPSSGERGNYSAAAAQLGRNKRSILLNLREAEAAEIVKKLIMEYDVVIEQFRPGVMDKLGIGYETLSVINPRLIYCSLTGYGHGNSMSDRAGHDINYLSLSGLSAYSGRRTEGPSLMGMQIADVASGSANVVIAVLAAVIHRAGCGRGQFLDISMTDGAIAFNAMWGAGYLVSGEAPEREGTLLNGGTLYDYYETKDGRYVSFGGLEPKFWEAFCRVLGHEEWIPLTVSAGAEIKAEARRILKTRELAHWIEAFKGADACFEPVLELDEALNSRLAVEREMVVDVPAGDGRIIKQIGSPYKFSESPVRFTHIGRPPSIEETAAVLNELGYSHGEIERLSKNGVLR